MSSKRGLLWLSINHFNHTNLHKARSTYSTPYRSPTVMKKGQSNRYKMVLTVIVSNLYIGGQVPWVKSPLKVTIVLIVSDMSSLGLKL